MTFSIHPVKKEIPMLNYMRCPGDDPGCCGVALYLRVQGGFSLIQGRFDTVKEAKKHQSKLEGIIL